MKLFLTTDTVGGVWTYCMELIRALAPRGVRVALATMGGPLRHGQRSEVQDLEDCLEVFESRYKLEWMNDPWEDVKKAGEWLLKLEEHVRPDVVHLNDYSHGALPFRAPTVVVAHSCVLSWWKAVTREPAPMQQWETYRRCVAGGLAAADAVVAPSMTMLDAVQEHYGPLNAGSMHVIHNGRDASLYAPREKEPIVVAAGRVWDEAKNLRALMEVAPRLPWSVHVAGDPRHPNGEGAVKVENVEPLGHLRPSVLARWLGRASIYALPALYEPFGLSVLEAANSACALVLGDIRSLREIWDDTAVYVDPRDTAALERELIELMRNPARRVRLGARAQERAKRYAPQAMADRYASLYRSLLGQVERALRSRADHDGAADQPAAAGAAAALATMWE